MPWIAGFVCIQLGRFAGQAFAGSGLVVDDAWILLVFLVNIAAPAQAMIGLMAAIAGPGHVLRRLSVGAREYQVWVAFVLTTDVLGGIVAAVDTRSYMLPWWRMSSLVLLTMASTPSVRLGHVVGKLVRRERLARLRKDIGPSVPFALRSRA